MRRGRGLEIIDRASQDDLLQIRNDLMTVYRDITRDGKELFPLRYARSTPRPRFRRADAVPVLILPDGPERASVLPYDVLRRSLAGQGVDVLMMEHRGVGLSRLDSEGQDLPAEAMRLEYVIEDVLAVLDHAEVDQVAIYGVGYGAYLAQIIAATYPERVRSLVLDSPLTSSRDELVSQQALRAAYWEGTVPGADTVAQVLRRLVENEEVDGHRLGPVLLAVHEHGGTEAVRDLVDLLAMGRGQLAVRSVRQVLTQGWLQSTPYVIEQDLVARIAHTELGSGHYADGLPLDALQLAAERARAVPPFTREPFDLHALAPQIVAPTLVIAGERDRILPPQIARDLVERVPQARLLEVPGTGHAILDAHSQIAQIAARWAAAGVPDLLADESERIATLPRAPLAQAITTGVRIALMAERWSPWRLRMENTWSTHRHHAPDPTSRRSRHPRVP